MQVTTEARVAVVAEEASVGLTADLVGTAAEVVGGGAPVATVKGAELVTGEAGRAQAANADAGASADAGDGAGADAGARSWCLVCQSRMLTLTNRKR